jgi:putative nucleotidyltransferase with HDIG domain
MTPEEAIAKATDLPMVSETARKLVVLLDKADTHRDEIVQTLRCDNVLTAKVLRACNAASVGLKHPVGSVDQAVLLLGSDTIFRMVCAIGFAGAMGYGQPGFAVEANGLWGHSLSIGLGSEYLTATESYGQFPPSLAFTAGLLHDIGKLVMNQVLTPSTRTKIRDMIASENVSRVVAEKAVLGFDHAELGACLLQKWSLPPPILEAVARHHAPVVQPTVQLSAVVYLANCAAHLASKTPGWDVYAVRANKAAADALSLDAQKLEEMVARVQGAMKAVNQYLHVV